jgi:deoxyribonuclease-4
MKSPIVNHPSVVRPYGGHVSCAGGLSLALERGVALGVTAIQVHPSAPQRWNIEPYSSGIEKEYLNNKKLTQISHLYFHGIYLINLASPDERKQNFAVRSLVNDLEFAHRCEASGVIFHLGSMKDEPDEVIAFERIASLVRRIIDSASGEAKLLFEVSAGSGKIVGSKFSQLAQIDRLVDRPTRIGFALDTQHLWASGHNLADDLDKIVDSFAAETSLSRIEVIHLNDSKTKLGSNIDRHENLGEGLIGYDTLKKVVNHPKLSHCSIILETPRMRSIDEAAIDLGILRKMIGITN